MTGGTSDGLFTGAPSAAGPRTRAVGGGYARDAIGGGAGPRTTGDCARCTDLAVGHAASVISEKRLYPGVVSNVETGTDVQLVY